MRWSAIRKRYESFLSAALAGRLEMHATRYRSAHDDEGRGWVTFDGAQIVSFESIPYLMRTYRLSSELKDIGLDTNDAWHLAIEAAHREGLFHLEEYREALLQYPDLTVEEALGSTSTITRALAMLDRRLGKRRLQTMDFATDEHPLVLSFYRLRRDAEGL